MLVPSPLLPGEDCTSKLPAKMQQKFRHCFWEFNMKILSDAKFWRKKLEIFNSSLCWLLYRIFMHACIYRIWDQSDPKHVSFKRCRIDGSSSIDFCSLNVSHGSFSAGWLCFSSCAAGAKSRARVSHSSAQPEDGPARSGYTGDNNCHALHLMWSSIDGYWI